MDGEQTKRSRIQIPLPSKPRPYRPGDGPPLAPLRIRPEHDSTAFLIDKRVLPGTARNGELQLQMYYVVGWRDAPAARVAILATKILEYVSPGVLEDFEYRALLERDEEAERQEALKQRKLEMAKKKKAVKSASATGTPTTPGTPTPPGQRRRGRPSKAELQARKLSKQASVNDSETIEVTLPLTSTSGPSLSTPQKKRATEIVTDMEDIDDADPEDAIHRQLCGESGDADEDTGMDVDESEKGGEEISLEGVPRTLSSGPEISSYARNLWLNKDTTLFKSANGNLALKSSTSHVPVPKVLRSNKQPWELPAITPLPPPIPKPRKPTPANYQPRNIPVPAGRKQSTTPVPVPTPLRSDKEIPPRYPQFQLQIQQKLELSVKPKPVENKQSTTPVPLPRYPRFTNEPSSSAPPPTPQPPKLSKPSPQLHGFTPAGRSSGRWPSQTPQSSGETAVDSPLNDQANGSLSKKRTPKSKLKPTTDNGQLWVVSRLEGDKLVHAHGRRTRFFKVRWAGEWPRDQNPTWEPEENIAPDLVKAYLKSKTKTAAGRRRTASSPANGFDSPSRTLRSTPLSLKRKYSSVAEAFAGDPDDLDELRNSADSNEEANGTVNNSSGRSKRREGKRINYYEDDEEDEILAVTTERESGFGRRGTNPKERMDEVGAAFMRDLAAAIHLGGGEKENRS